MDHKYWEKKSLQLFCSFSNVHKFQSETSANEGAKQWSHKFGAANTPNSCQQFFQAGITAKALMYHWDEKIIIWLALIMVAKSTLGTRILANADKNDVNVFVGRNSSATQCSLIWFAAVKRLLNGRNSWPRSLWIMKEWKNSQVARVKAHRYAWLIAQLHPWQLAEGYGLANSDAIGMQLLWQHWARLPLPVIYGSNSLSSLWFLLLHVDWRYICQIFIVPIFLHCAITSKTTRLFITARHNYVMGLNATIDRLECYQLGDLSC